MLPSASTGAGGKGGASRSFPASSSAYLAGEKENFLEVAARIMTERLRPIPAWICRESIECTGGFFWGGTAIDGVEVWGEKFFCVWWGEEEPTAKTWRKN